MFTSPSKGINRWFMSSATETATPDDNGTSTAACRTEGWLCIREAHGASEVRVSVHAVEPMSAFDRVAIRDVVEMVSTTADVDASALLVEVQQLGAHDCRVNLTIAVDAEAVASAIAEELRALLRTAASASERFAFAIAAPPLVVVTTPQPTAGAWSGATAVSATSGARDGGDSSTVAVTRATTTSNEGAGGPSASDTDVEADLDYYHRMRALNHLHLGWLLPILVFLYLACCFAWWCSSTHAVKRARMADLRRGDARQDRGGGFS